MMLFHEIYGSYFNVVAAVLSEAVKDRLTDEELTRLTRQKAFAESVLTIPHALKSETWPLLTKDLRTPLQHIPTMPLTLLQKRWLKALLSDPRIRLFSPSMDGLEDVEPLYQPDTFVYFDRYTDGDPYDDEDYIACFRMILTALREKRKLRIKFVNRKKRRLTWECVPYKLEYSAKDDKFRLRLFAAHDGHTINLARIRSCELLEPYSEKAFTPNSPKRETLVLELRDERNALERVMLHFSHLEKETERLDENTYRMTLHYDREDETEMLIRVLSFGPILHVISPSGFITKLKERLDRQEKLRTT